VSLHEMARSLRGHPRDPASDKAVSDAAYSVHYSSLEAILGSLSMDEGGWGAEGVSRVTFHLGYL